ncbi:hypothetical protein CC79DRAFT_1365105 [Sarocladium strictum]
MEQQKQQQNGHLKPQPSLFFRSRDKRSESSMGLRKSLRNSSNTSAALSSAFSGQSLTLSKHSGLRNTARRVSQSLRIRVKGLFSRPKLGEGFSSLDDADTRDSREHMVSDLDEEEIPECEISMNHVTSHMPSLHAVSSFQQIQSRKGSVESLELALDHVNDDKSRVTSWTNSVTNTLPSQSAAGEWERQRLSVIKENGAHISSPSLMRPPHGLSPEMSINNDRVYAALMKRMEQVEASSSPTNVCVENMSLHGLPPPRCSSAEPLKAPTIRCVPSEDDVFSDRPQTHGQCTIDEVGTNGLKSYMLDTASLPRPSPARTGQGSPRSMKSKTVSHRSSAFFGSPSTHLFRTTSPYRRALQQQITVQPGEQGEGSSSDQHLGAMSPILLPPRRPSTIGSEGWQTKASEGSVYSVHDEDAATNPQSVSGALVDHFPKPPTMGTSQVHQKGRDPSTVSSVEWKTLLSSDVASREAALHNAQNLGHVREQAEIESPDERLKGTAGQSTPLRPISVNSRSGSVKISQSHEQGTAMLENERPSPRATTQTMHKTPPIPARSALRTIPPRQYTVGMSHDDRGHVKGSGENWPLPLSSNMGGSCGPSTKAGPYTRSRLDHVMTHSSQTSPLLPPRPDFQRPSTASPGHRGNWTLDKTLHRLHLRDSTSMFDGSDDTQSGGNQELSATASKRMVDLFLSSRRRKGQRARSHSTSDSSAAFV